MTPAQSLDLALAYSRRHPTRYLFPIRAGAKSPPCFPGNLVKASNDPAVLTRWAKKYPGCNWGVSLAKSSLLVVDVDCKPGQLGDQTFDGLSVAYGWPDTETVRTPNGGRHHYYDGPHIFALGKNGFGLGVDSPNYVLIPGSEIKGVGSYDYITDQPSVPMPDWFGVVLGKARKRVVVNAAEAVVDLDLPNNVAWAVDYLSNDAPSAIEGSGGEFTTMTVAMTLRDHGISEPKAVELIDQYYNVPGCCEPTWDDLGELTIKVRNGYRYANQSQAGASTAQAEFAGDIDLSSITPEIMGKRARPRHRFDKQRRKSMKRAAALDTPYLRATR